jgi:streptomycin 6-kinase
VSAAGRPIPEAFARATREVYGERGEAWLAALPARLAALERRWAITLEAPFPGLFYNYVAPARRADGEAVVLKAGVPNRELETEIAALRHYHGRGSVRLLEADPEAGALLLERLEPGTPLAVLDDDEAATRIAAGVMRELWRPAPPEHAFPSVADWGEGFERLRARFDRGTGPLPAALVERAEGLFRELLASAAPSALLHGDLHHENILAAGRAPWLAIDPKGVVGEPAYETGAFLRNPLPRILAAADPRGLLERRIEIFTAELGLERERLRGWALAQVLLSAWWMIEDHGRGWEEPVALAEALIAADG